MNGKIGTIEDRSLRAAESADEVFDRRRIAWAIRHCRNGIYIDTVRRTRREALRAFKTAYNFSQQRWIDESKVCILRAVRVDVRVWEGHKS